MRLSRRSVLRATAATVAAPALGILSAAAPVGRASGQTQIWRHALSLFGDIKYPEGFAHFDYVNSNAPQGGKLRKSAIGTFDNFNTVVSGGKGEMVVRHNLYSGSLKMT